MTDVERYYERNTRRFLRFGGGGSRAAIHRQLWGPGVTNAAGAASHINELAAAAIREACPQAPTVLDLGCGVGGTAIHLATALPASRVVGITLSGLQVDIATSLAKKRRVANRCKFVQGNFESVRLDVNADAAVAIEAFTHSASTGAFFETAAAHLQPDGLLIVVDDFLLREDAVSLALADTFKRGWRTPAFTTTGACAGVAARAGFELVDERDLTALIRLDRLRDRLISALAPVADRLGLESAPFFGNLIGGNALRRGLADGSFGYRWLAFRRRA